MKRNDVEILHSLDEKKKRLRFFWFFISLFLFVCGVLNILYKCCPESFSLINVLFWTCVEGIATFFYLRRKQFLLLFIPLLILLVVYMPMSIFYGLAGIADNSIIQINSIYQIALHTSNIAYTTRQLTGAVAFLCDVCFVIYAIGMFEHHEKIKYILCFLLVLYVLVVHQVSALSCALFCTSILVNIFMNHDFTVPRGRYLGMFLAIASVLVCSVAYGDVETVTLFREKMIQDFHDFRYGKDVLPLGNLNQASKLREAEGNMMTITSQQSKNMYLKAYTGANYQDGIWQEEAESVYEIDYEGMENWLKDKNFDPLTQVSQYNSLCDDSNGFSENEIQISVQNASRETAYFPASISSFSGIKVKEEHDERYLSDNLIPKRNYSLKELSGSYPSEITIAKDWLENPNTDAQKQYAEAESVYRSFVYDVYAKANSTLYPILYSTFWADYQSDTDSVYSAITHVRDCLSKIETNEKTFESDADPVVLYLQGNLEANQVVMSTSAVEALRAHGIPARYAEGYYISSNELDQSDTVQLNTNHAHAWVEVYFDGVGWLPVDVIPGYYKDAVSLQNMVGMPDSVHKSAMLSQNKKQAEQFSTGSNENAKDHSNLVSQFVILGKQILGIFALICIMITVLFCIIELVRMLLTKFVQKQYQNISYERKMKLIQKMLIYILSLRGISAVIGWHTKEIDAEISDMFETVEDGDYERVCSLMEKVLYGGQQLEEFEQRTVKALLESVFENNQNLTIKNKLKKHFSVFYCIFALRDC